jgi:CTP synthase
MVLNTRWMGADDLLHYPGVVIEADAVVLAPPGPRTRKVLPLSLLEALSLVRERDLPLLATGESHGLVFVEIARKILGLEEATSTWYEPYAREPVVHTLEGAESLDRDERTRELDCEVGDHPLIASLYGDARRVTEVTDVVCGLNPDYAEAIENAGCVPAVWAAGSNRPVLHVMEGRRWYVTAGFLPQLRSTPQKPHPLFSGLMDVIAERG